MVQFPKGTRIEISILFPTEISYAMEWIDAIL